MTGLNILQTRKTLSFIFLLLLILPPLTCPAAETAGPAATVVAIRGKVEAIDAAGKSRLLAVKNPLFVDDSIKTGPRGRIQILFTDNTIYSLSGNSEMRIAEYDWQPEKKQGTLKTEVKEGVFRVMGGAITKHSPENFTTETPAATIGIRGSMYAGTVTGDTLSVVFQGGKGIEVTNPFGTVAITRPGFGTRATMNSAPSAPARFSEQEVAAMGNGDNGEEEVGEETAETGEETAEEENMTGDETTVATGDEGETPADTVEGETGEESVAADTTLSGETTTVATTTLTTPVVTLPPTNETSPIIETTVSTTVVPTDGINGYLGSLSGKSILLDGSTSAISDKTWIEINWHNGKVLGRIGGISGEAPAFFIGRISGNQIVDVKVLGSGSGGSDYPSVTDPGLMTAITGSGSGMIFGAAYDYLNFTANGSGYEIQPATQPLFDTWTVQGPATKETAIADDAVSPKGTSAWKGFVTGVSENMANINSGRRLFLNTKFTEFAFTMDKDKGTLSGKLSAADVNGASASLVDISIGGALPSAFILEDNFAAVLGCPSGACVSTSGSTGGLKKYTNYLVSADPKDANEISEYVTWGYWEIAYTDPATGAAYHTHVPGSRWIAGELTSLTELQNLATANFTGHYTGPVFASRIDTAVKDLQGSFALDVDFANLDAANAVQGLINIDGTTLQVANVAGTGYATSGGFHGTVSHATDTVYSSSFNGAFFGPKAESIGGNFHAQFSNRSYVGIFGGKR